MHYLFAAGVLALLLYFRFGTRAVALALFALAALASARGLFVLAVPLVLLALYIMKQNSLFPKSISGQRSTTAKNPSVRSKFLEMQLDQTNGRLTGKIHAGPYAGVGCDKLNLEQLLELLLLYQQQDSESEQLIMAYLDQAYPNWHESAKNFERSEAKPAGRAMSVRDAYDILGVSPSATAEEIKAAHRRLMKKFHPDHGGSAHLAASINQAKDILLNE